MMNRREALSRVALIMGGTVLGAEAFLAGCTTGAPGLNFSKSDIAFLNEIAETIMPATNTPGAKEAKVGEFMTVIVNDCYEAKDQTAFMEGLKKLNEACTKAINKSFMEATSAERNTFLTALDKEAAAFQKTKKPTEQKHYFTMFKELTLWGFFSSEVGATKVLRYIAVPGKYEGSIPYKKGDKAWAT